MMTQEQDEHPPSLSSTKNDVIEGNIEGFKATRIGGVILTPPDINDDGGDEHKQRQVENEQNENRQEHIDIVELLRAVEVLTHLGAMDSVEYQDRLVTNTLPSTTNHPNLIRLSESIRRYQSDTLTLTKEYDRQTTEVVELQKQVNESQERILKLETAVKKLHNRNKKLQKENKSEKSLVKKLAEEVRQLQESADNRSEEFYRLADEVHEHEKSLREYSNLISRTDSDVSDLDSVSGHSLVTDDGIATLKIHRDGALTWFPDQDALSPLSLPKVDPNPFANAIMQKKKHKQGHHRRAKSADFLGFFKNVNTSNATSSREADLDDNLRALSLEMPAVTEEEASCGIEIDINEFKNGLEFKLEKEAQEHKNRTAEFADDDDFLVSFFGQGGGTTKGRVDTPVDDTDPVAIPELATPSVSINPGIKSSSGA